MTSKIPLQISSYISWREREKGGTTRPNNGTVNDGGVKKKSDGVLRLNLMQ